MFFYYLLTQRCNLACSHCIRGFSKHHDMDFDLALEGLDKIAKFDDNSTLVLTGGEPTLYPHFQKLLRRALSLFKDVIVTTNGTTGVFLENAKEWIGFSGLHIQFSVDGGEAAHDAMRGQGSFQKAMHDLEVLSDMGIPMWVSTVATSENIESLEELRDELIRMRVKKWHINPVLPFGCGAGLKMPSLEEWNSCVDAMIETCPMKLGVKKLYDFTMLDGLSDAELITFSNIAVKRKSRNCGSGNLKAYIYPDFSVYGCTCMSDIPLGNLVDNDVEEILGSPNAKKIKEYRVLEDSPCCNCRYLTLCNGGCIGMSLHTFGVLGMGDSRCPRWQKIAESFG